jgi:hypothetical protein
MRSYLSCTSCLGSVWLTSIGPGGPANFTGAARLWLPASSTLDNKIKGMAERGG